MIRNESAPLHGVRVLEIGTHGAGAFAAAVLADLGADVVKVESGAGEPDLAARNKELISELMQYPDYGEGVRALVEKRTPRFGS